MRSFLVVVAPAVILVGCASLEGRDRNDEMEALRARVVELQRQTAMHEVEIDRLRRKIASLEGKAPTDPSPAPARGARDVSAPDPEAPPEAPPRPLSSLEESDLEPEPPPPVPESRAPVETAPATEPVPPEAQRTYDEAYTLYHRGDHVEAERLFREFLESNPSTELSDNALFWVGAARYAGSDFEGALAAFRETVERYPDGNKVPDALFKIGQCLETLGAPDEAREVYRELERRFPTTAAAAMASDRLEDLR